MRPKRKIGTAMNCLVNSEDVSKRVSDKNSIKNKPGMSVTWLDAAEQARFKIIAAFSTCAAASEICSGT